MKVLIFNGALDRRENSTSERLSNYLLDLLLDLNADTHVFKMVDSAIPLFDNTLSKTPMAVERMNLLFREADVHIWLTPLYHGCMTGVMKNCLDWLECSAKLPEPYLTGKMIGMVCWADGVQAMQGINAMEAVAKSLRAWTLPYSVPAKRDELFDERGNVSEAYQHRFGLLLRLLTHGPKVVVPEPR
ncbi:NADPH-dependent FMN reductase [Niastella yeongjuensis]|uniref:NADPH-dependent FMN reductase n=1 Tax=Niastella yeongjuensis TaxID=354355 RepID=A0A1V9E9H1_9BACT|nr:NAD(P)H-dependent oxidoreductase [Niastella yeongjuensis]OQP42756.1 NADPH-dependent FMN reductase [Niastella yeongjuensis]SEO52602.1 arsenical resistance protein ArsH [Niastella yeongjuensis]